VNPETNYRYYSSAQFERLNTILYLRALDVPIERIAEFFEGRNVELMRGIFEEQLQSVQAKREQLVRIEQKIRSRIEQIDDATASTFDKPVLRELPGRNVAMLAESFSPSTDLEPLLRHLSYTANLNDAIFLGKVGVSVSAEDLLARTFERLSDARHEERGRSRLRDIVVRASVESADLVLLRIERRQKDDRRLAVRAAHRLADRVAVHSRHHDVEQHEVGTPFAERGHACRARCRDTDREARLAQLTRQGIADRPLVVYQQYFCHAAIIP
jgi:hypothetical protein